MTVWVAVAGVYSSKGVTGVYATVDAGIAANPIPKQITRTWSNLSRPGGWRQDKDGSWDNGLDWEDAVSLEPFEVEGAVVIQISTDEDGGGS